MKIDARIATRQWEQAAVEQLAANLERDGYKVEREANLQGVHVDLLASRGEEMIICEVKVPDPAGASAWVTSVAKMQAIAKDIGARFRLVVVRVPHETSIYIEGLESAIERYLIEHTPEKILELAHDATVLDVDGVHLTSLTYVNGFDLVGTGDVLVSLPTRGIDVDLPFAFAGEFALAPEDPARPLRVTALKTFEIDASMLN